MNNPFPDEGASGGFLGPLVKRLAEEHPKETELVACGGLTLICAIAFFKKLKAYLIQSGPAAHMRLP